MFLLLLSCLDTRK